jgi:hypothetical protein
MFNKSTTVTVTVERTPWGRYYAAVRWTRANPSIDGMRVLMGSFRDTAHAARRIGRLHLVQVGLQLRASFSLARAP